MALTSSSFGPILDANMISVEKRGSTADRVSAAIPLESQLRIVPVSEYKAAGQCLAEAFAEDHVALYPIDTPDRAHWTGGERFNLHRQAFEYITYAHCLKGLVTTVGYDYRSVALWMPPGKNMDDWLTILRSGMWRLNFQLSSEGRKRFFKEFLPLLHTTKAEVMGERDSECWYLVYIGTKVASRGKGYARKLVEHITDRVSVSAAFTEYSSILPTDRDAARPIVKDGRAIWRVQTISIPSFTGKWASKSSRRYTWSEERKTSEWISW